MGKKKRGKKAKSGTRRAAQVAKPSQRGGTAGAVMLPPPPGPGDAQAIPDRDTDLDLVAVSSPTIADATPPREARDTLTELERRGAPLEHRAAPRISVALEVEIHQASDSHFFTGLSGDISEGGLFVSTYKRLDIGAPVEVEFSLPGGHVTARGAVRWARDASPGAPPGFGISFDELPANDREIIQKFCSTRPPLYYDDVG